MFLLKKKSGLIFVIVLSFFSILPFFHSGFFSMHDDTQVVRVYEMAKALRDGQFPVRWVADLGYGYGYPIFNFYSPLPYYLGGFLNLIGLDALLATKLMMGLGILLSGIFMYFLAKEFWGEIGGVVAGLFYTYAPYHALDIYVRGAVGEFWAMAFLPLMALGFYKAIRQKQWRWVIVGSFGYTGVILSHNLTAMMVTPFLIVALIIFSFNAYKRKKLYAIRYALYAFLFGLGLSAFYWLPAILEMGYTNVSSQIGGGADFRNHFVCIQQLWDSPWGFGGSAPGCIDGFSFRIGKLHILAVLFSLLPLFGWWQKKKLESRMIFISILFFLVSVFLMLEISKPIWEAVPVMAYIQYPWRFLIFVTFTSSFLAGAVFRWIKSNSFRLMACSALLAVLLFYNIKYFQPQKYLSVSTQDYLSEENIKWKTSKISDEYLPKYFPIPKNSSEIVKEKIETRAEVTDLEIKSNQYTFKTSSQETQNVLAKTAYFPGWQVFIDGQKAKVMVNNSLINFMTPEGQHQIKISFQETSLRFFADFLSLLSFVILLGGIKYGRKVTG